MVELAAAHVWARILIQTHFCAIMKPAEIEVIQEPDDWASRETIVSSLSATPVFLIHDGGGTTFSYHCLGSLHRRVYGIANPRFFAAEPFPGGLPEMGRLYASKIREFVSQPASPTKTRRNYADVLLGGWSLGGMLSLEVAKALEDVGDVRVVGILMIDSVYPDWPASERSSEITKPERPRTRIHRLCQQNMAVAREMLRSWEVPRFSTQRPHALLLRATGRVPMGDPDATASPLDARRDEDMLGWDRHDRNMFRETLPIDGHHFDLFLEERIDATTRVLRLALDKLDRLAS